METKLSKKQIQRLGETTHDDYWDCNCTVNYIHSKVIGNFCTVCKAEEQDMPDARVLEIYEHYDPDADMAKKL